MGSNKSKDESLDLAWAFAIGFIMFCFKIIAWILKHFSSEIFCSRIGRAINNVYFRNVKLNDVVYICLGEAIVIGTGLVLVGGKYNEPINSSIMVVVFLVTLTIVVVNDLDAIEAFFFKYKKSNYYLSTGVGKRKLWGVHADKGAQGEFMLYVLSRQIKVPHKVLYNVCIPMQNGNYQEIDGIIISRNVIYVLEAKNRSGIFSGTWEDENWIRESGRHKEAVKNIYLQNQKHTMALDKLLLDHGIIQNGESVCINVILNAGTMTLPYLEKKPLDLVVGSRRQIANYINKKDAKFDDGNDTTQIMERVYELLLPYALYTGEERERMLYRRTEITENDKNGKFSNGVWHERTIAGGISGVTEPGENAVVRKNNLYTQLKINDGKKSFWQTRTDISADYFGEKERKNNINYMKSGISTGVDNARIEDYKAACTPLGGLYLKKIVYAILIGSFVFLQIIK